MSRSTWAAASCAALCSRRRTSTTSCADALICGDERTVYADKAYDSKARRAALKARGIRNGIMRRWHWAWPEPSRWQQRRNQLLVHRAPIEPLFALFKHVYGFARVRYPRPVTQRGRPAPCCNRHEPQTLEHRRKNCLNPTANRAPRRQAPFRPRHAALGSLLAATSIRMPTSDELQHDPRDCSPVDVAEFSLPWARCCAGRTVRTRRGMHEARLHVRAQQHANQIRSMPSFSAERAREAV